MRAGTGLSENGIRFVWQRAIRDGGGRGRRGLEAWRRIGSASGAGGFRGRAF
jgi:hypothetical protein